MVNESCEAPFLFTLFHIVKLLLILTNLLFLVNIPTSFFCRNIFYL